MCSRGTSRAWQDTWTATSEQTYHNTPEDSLNQDVVTKSCCISLPKYFFQVVFHVQSGDKKGLAGHLDRCGPSMAKALLASAEVTAALNKAETGAASGLRSIASRDRLVLKVCAAAETRLLLKLLGVCCLSMVNAAQQHAL